MATELDSTTERRAAPTRRRTIPLSGTLAAVMAGLVALTAIDVLAVFWLMTAGTTRDLLADAAQLGLDSVQARIADRFTPVQDQLAFLSREIAAGRIDPGDGVALDRLMTGALAGTPQVRVLSFVAPDGAIRGVTQGPEGVFAFTDTIHTDGERQEIEQARGRTEAAWGPVYFVADPALRTSVANLSQPAHAGGAFAGIFTATLTVDALSDHLKAIAEANPGTTPFILYGRDRVLAHPAMVAQRPALSREQPLPGLDALGDPFLAALWTEGTPEAVGDADLDARVVRRGGDGRVILTRTIAGYAPVPLTVGVEVPVSALDKPTNDLIRAGLAGLAVLAIAILVAIWVSRMIVRPVGAMAREVRAVGSLDFAALHPLPGSVFSELNDQARAYNTMLTGLRWLETYVPKSLVRRLLRSGTGEVASAERMVTVMFTDVVDFTAVAEHMPAAGVAAMLNAHFDLLGRCVEAEGGTIDKFIGDCVMAFWGAPDDQPDHADRALRAARAIAAAVAADNAARRGHGLPAVRVRIGIHSGPVVAGNIGMTGRSGYTIVGDTVNLGNRLEQLGKTVAPGDEVAILVSGATVALSSAGRSGLRALGAQAVSGRRAEIEVYRLEAEAS